MQEEELPASHVFENTIFTSSRSASPPPPPRPAQKREPAAQKAKKMEKKETSNPTQASFDTGGNDEDPQRVYWDGAKVSFEYSSVKYAKEGCVNQAAYFFEKTLLARCRRRKKRKTQHGKPQ